MLTVSLNNEAKSKYSYLEGIYELTPDLHLGYPKWKIRGGNHEIESVSNIWYIRPDGTNDGINTEGQPKANVKMPDDPNYKWHIYDGQTYVETASGNVKIHGTYDNFFPKIVSNDYLL